jgi:hypothetical protein
MVFIRLNHCVDCTCILCDVCSASHVDVTIFRFVFNCALVSMAVLFLLSAPVFVKIGYAFNVMGFLRLNLL